MSCTNIEQHFQELSSHISDEIYKKSYKTDPWIELVERDEWENGVGTSYSYNVFERAVPPTLTWTAVASSTGSDQGACNQTAQTMSAPGQTLKQVSLYKAAIQGPDFCLEDLQFVPQVMERVRHMMDSLSLGTKWSWSRYTQTQYITACGHKIVAEATMPESSGASFPAVEPTSKLTLGILEDIHVQLGYDGGDEYASGYGEEGEAIYTVLTDKVTIDNVIRDNEDVRQDIRWGKLVDKLGAPIGAGIRNYRGFMFKPIQFPKRYTYAGGVFTEVEPWTTEATTKGLIYKVSDAYRNAPYQTTVIFVKNVLRLLIPKPVTRFADMNFQFDPKTFMGDFRWVNEYDRDCNPDKMTGFFRGLFMAGPKSPRPELGYVIMHKRCDPVLGLGSCAGADPLP